MRRPKRMPLAQLAPFILELPDLASPLDFAAVFARSAALELEIGCGKGGFLVAAATERPEHDFVGVEIDRALHYSIASRLARRSLTNARIVAADARILLRDRVADGDVDALHVYFPDPWWKARHHKRRIWTPAFAADCVRVLRPEGRLKISTDVAEYYGTMRELLDARVELERIAADEQTGEPASAEALTNFERKARASGGSTWRAEYRRRA